MSPVPAFKRPCALVVVFLPPRIPTNSTHTAKDWKHRSPTIQRNSLSTLTSAYRPGLDGLLLCMRILYSQSMHDAMLTSHALVIRKRRSHPHLEQMRFHITIFEMALRESPSSLDCEMPARSTLDGVWLRPRTLADNSPGSNFWVMDITAKYSILEARLSSCCYIFELSTIGPCRVLTLKSRLLSLK
ncbi:uncharacterized protein B0J16DRAFT_97414 [Fusarium flagelliforme]|uniref:uncharacterized protein n=1 Tax=Fusarium flagelliforme TaxID=2675880 RepID=UPI001E8D4187|nr:uncharacterized protein B0J16DRAFT_97414 [Fusarium flagelliforme]KAH7188592.1 hypothetical protein B0J16DRAFT_97414 [Fusarium flagelliforme]